MPVTTTPSGPRDDEERHRAARTPWKGTEPTMTAALSIQGAGAPETRGPAHRPGRGTSGAERAAAADGLPDPRPLLENLGRCVIEALSGARDLEQLARWVSDDVYRALLKRVVLASRARRAKGITARRPQFSIGRTTMCSPADGVVEAVVMVHSRVRARAVAIRLEGFDHRWRASAISVL